ncbi:DnaD domain protein [Aquibacillus koreensis]|uniref:DnaD domain protein n=1 Tax=Aquibacillus koreensis TaxID=279446 RepID=A0A9X4AH00_9BACI|nr:DnaD domain protein [Aquibacillus koreensis]MCT2534787.1 DnaD domain protein [Aquibacillus koreensis]MDC3419602.1 DnaD domain protein [Aquibacillus koreensis]
MNYLKELNAFKEWTRFHSLPVCAVALWHTLMLLNNAVRWRRSFNVPNTTIEQLSGLNPQRLSEARKILAAHNLISYQPGTKGKAPIYQMMSLVAYFDGLSASTDQSITQSEEPHEAIHAPMTEESQDTFQEPMPEVYPEPSRNNSRDIHKGKEKDKQKENRGRGDALNAYTVYEQNFGILKPIVQELFLSWCDDLGDALMIEAIKLAAQKGGRSFSYIESILKEWTQAGVKTLEQARNYEQQKKHHQPNVYLMQKKSKNKAIFDKLRKDAQA